MPKSIQSDELGAAGGTGRKTIGLAVLGLAAAAVVGAIALTSTFGGGGGESKEQSRASTTAAIDILLADVDDLLRRNEAEQAAVKLAEAVGLVPDDQRLRLLYGRALQQQGKSIEAYAEYEAAIAIGPTDDEIEFAAGMVANKAATAAAAGGAVSKATNYRERAREHFVQALLKNPGDPRYSFYLGHLERAMGDDAASRTHLLMAVLLDPEQPTAWGVLADIAFTANKLSVASAHLAKARELDPVNPTWKLIEAKMRNRQNKPAAALQLLWAIERDVFLGDERILEVAAASYGMLQQPKEAAALYAAALRANPGVPSLLLESALWHDRAGLRDRAINDARAAAMFGDTRAKALVDRLESKN